MTASRRFDDRARLVFFYAREEAAKLGHGGLAIEHLLLGLLREGGISAGIIAEYLTIEQLREKIARIPRRVEKVQAAELSRVQELAQAEARSMGASMTGAEHIFLGILRESESYAAALMREWDIPEALRERLSRRSRNEKKSVSDVKTSLLNEYGRDLTHLAREGHLDPVIGREDELERMIQILTRRSKNNPVLVGAPGVGKTAIVEALAQKIVSGDVPKQLQKQLIGLDMSQLLSGTKYRGEFEERMGQLTAEIKKSGAIVFIDEIHTIIGAGSVEGTLDAANILKPALSRGEIQMIGATTNAEYRHIEKDAALERRFQPININEPSPAQTLDILKGVKAQYEQHHSLIITDDLLERIIERSEKGFIGRNFPDKALDLLDEAASYARLRINRLIKNSVTKQNQEEKTEQKDRLTLYDIEAVIGSIDGRYQEEKLATLQESLSQKVYGQPEAIKRVVSSLKRAHVGLGGRHRVIASFLFIGSSGVGKTHLTKALAHLLFGSERALIRIDMSEYGESYSLSKLIGSPPGYIGFEQGGKLTESVKNKPASIILLDEIEKAHSDIYNIFLQILDDGRLTDGKGQEIDFRRTLIIMTSNLGANTNPTIGFQPNMPDPHLPLKHHFSAEFLDRLDGIIHFAPLQREQLIAVADQLLKEMRKELKSRQYNVEIAPDISEWLVNQLTLAPKQHATGSSRQLRSLIREKIEEPLADILISQSLKDITEDKKHNRVQILLSQDNIKIE